MMQVLNLQPLINATTRLQEGWLRYLQDIGDTQIRNSLIQRFEFTYETPTVMPIARHIQKKVCIPYIQSAKWNTANYQRSRSSLM